VERNLCFAISDRGLPNQKKKMRLDLIEDRVSVEDTTLNKNV